MNVNDVVTAWSLQSVDPTPWDKLPEEKKIQYAITYATAIAVIEYNQKMQVYATEMKCGSVTLDELINSHRELRLANHERHETYLQVRKEANEKGVAEAREQALKNNWFSREQLVEMSVGELAKALMY